MPTHRIISRAAIAFAALSFVLPGLAGAAVPTQGGVQIVNFQFNDQTTGTPVTVVTAGSAVTFHEFSGVHTVTSDDGSFVGSDAQYPGGIPPGHSVSATFATSGVYRYHCAIHASMHGVIVVV